MSVPSASSAPFVPSAPFAPSAPSAPDEQPLQESEAPSNETHEALQAEFKQINADLRKSMEKMVKTKDDCSASVRAEIAYGYYRRGALRLNEHYKDFVGSMYDLTRSLQYNVTPLCFYKRGELFAKLEFYEQALADLESCYEYSTNQKDKEALLPRILKLKEAIETLENA